MKIINKVIHNWIHVTLVMEKYISIQQNIYKTIVLLINVIEI